MDALSTIQRLGGGQLIEDIAEALAVTSADVIRTGQEGAVTVTLKVTPLSGAADNAVCIEDQIARKPPKRKGRGAILFSHEGELWKADPRQTEMKFETVETTNIETGEITETIRPARKA